MLGGHRWAPSISVPGRFGHGWRIARRTPGRLALHTGLEPVEVMLGEDPGYQLGPAANAYLGEQRLDGVIPVAEPSESSAGHSRASGVTDSISPDRLRMTSAGLRDPDGARLELIADPLGEMYGTKVR